MQTHLKEAQPMAIHLVCSLLERLPRDGSNGSTPITTAALDSLRCILSTLPSVSTAETRDLSLKIVTLLIPFFSSAEAALQGNNNTNGNNNNTVSVLTAAMLCLQELLSRPQTSDSMVNILLRTLPALVSVCSSWTQQNFLFSAADGGGGDLLATFMKLLLQVLQRALPITHTHSNVSAAVQLLLRQFADFVAGQNSSIALLAAAEVWHSVLTYMEELEASYWGGEEQDNGNDDEDDDDDDGFLATATQAALYRAGVLQLTVTLLSPFFSSGQSTITTSRVLRMEALDASPGSGAALEDWIALVADTPGGNEANNDGGGGATGIKEEEEDDDDDDDGDYQHGDNGLDGSSLTKHRSPQNFFSHQFPSERAVYTLHAEYFTAHAVSTYSSALMPLLLNQLTPAMHAAYTYTTSITDSTFKATPHEERRTACERAMLALRLIARCAPHFPCSGLNLNFNFTNSSSVDDSLAAPIIGGDEVQQQKVTGSHVLHLLHVLLQYCTQWNTLLRSITNIQQQQQMMMMMGDDDGGSDDDTMVVVVVVDVSGVCSTLYQTLSAILIAWLPQIIVRDLSTDPDEESIIIQLILSTLNAFAEGLTTGTPPPPRKGMGSHSSSAAVAAAQGLLLLTSVPLSNGMKPSAAILNAVATSPASAKFTAIIPASLSALQQQQQHSSSSLLPRVPPVVSRLVCVALSDLTLRSWGQLIQSNTVSVVERKNDFATVTAPLLHCLQTCPIETTPPTETGASQSPSSSSSLSSSKQLCLAVVLATDVILGFNGSSKAVRAAAYSVFVEPCLQAILPLLVSARKDASLPTSSHSSSHSASSSTNNKSGNTTRLSSAMLRFISACLCSFPAELGVSGTNELLSTLVAMYSSTPTTDNSNSNNNTEAAISADLTVLSIITTSLGQGGNKYQSLALPAIEFGLRMGERAAAAAAGATATTHVKAQIIVSLLNILRHHHKFILEGSCATSTSATAAAVFNWLCSFFSEAADLRAVPSSSEVRLILEELFDLQSVSKLFWKPYFSAWKEALLDSILAILLTRMYSGAQDYLVDTLYALAASNWSEFLLVFMPAFAERRLAAKLGAARAQELVANVGVTDMEASTFEKAVLSFVNDAICIEKSM